MKRLLYLAALAVLLTPLASHAQITFDIDRLDNLFDAEPTVEVNLRGSLRRSAVSASLSMPHAARSTSPAGGSLSGSYFAYIDISMCVNRAETAVCPFDGQAEDRPRFRDQWFSGPYNVDARP